MLPSNAPQSTPDVKLFHPREKDMGKSVDSAMDIASSCFVFASAGSGKTKVLVDRYVKSLFFGMKPREILCLTFTNAAAFEMKSRISNILENLYLNENDFAGSYLREIIGIKNPSDADFARAARLAFDFLEEQGGSKITTIHSFCQNLLWKFPCEAGIDSNFEIANDREISGLIAQAKQAALKKICDMGQEETLVALSRIFSGYSFDELIRRIFSDTAKFMRFFDAHNDLVAYRKRLEKLLEKGAQKEYSKQQRKAISEMLQNDDFDETDLEHAFLTSAGDIRKKYQENEIAHIVFENFNSRKAEAIIEKTIRFLEITKVIFDEYSALKQQAGLIDFSDVLLLARGLLQKSRTPNFVLFRICSDIRSVMVDEAQDLSPLQWQLISLFCEDLAADPQSSKTMFIVGDIKQSIYRFQDADYKQFLAFYEHWRRQLEFAGRSFYTIHMNKNYRSLGKILEATDRVFEGVFDNYNCHVPHRDALAGAVELIEISDDEDRQSVEIAGYIKDLDVLPHDLLILTRSRTRLSSAVAEKLREMGVKVAPPDRVSLSESLLIMDITALAEICDNFHEKRPHSAESNYKLACILKSPYLFENPLTNEHLLDLCNSDDPDLFAGLGRAHPDKLAVLKEMIKKYDPYELVMFFLRVRELVKGRLEPGDEHVLCAFLEEVIRFSRRTSESIPEFLADFRRTETFVSSQNVDEEGVRLSTIHGAKGTESPVVCLLDFELQPNKSQTRFLWRYESSQHQGGVQDRTLFVVKPSRAESTRAMDAMLDAEYAEDREESLRLLYVAMTRAEERLIVFGAPGGKDTAYGLIKGAVG